jgi:hypothetical protein
MKDQCYTDRSAWGDQMATKTIRRFAAALALSSAFFPSIAGAQFSLRHVPLGFCSDSSLGSAAALSAFTCASFTGTGSGTTLTASSVSGSIQPGQTVSGTGVPSGTTIVAQLTNTSSTGTPGRSGTYQTSQATTSSGASLTTSGVPTKADYAVICATTAAINWRDDGTAPTGTAGTGGNGIAAGNCIRYDSTFSQLQFIQQASGGIVGINYYFGGGQ